jgi:hypothetical protein
MQPPDVKIILTHNTMSTKRKSTSKHEKRVEQDEVVKRLKTDEPSKLDNEESTTAPSTPTEQDATSMALTVSVPLKDYTGMIDKVEDALAQFIPRERVSVSSEHKQRGSYRVPMWNEVLVPEILQGMTLKDEAPKQPNFVDRDVTLTVPTFRDGKQVSGPLKFITPVVQLSSVFMTGIGRPPPKSNDPKDAAKQKDNCADNTQGVNFFANELCIHESANVSPETQKKMREELETFVELMNRLVAKITILYYKNPNIQSSMKKQNQDSMSGLSNDEREKILVRLFANSFRNPFRSPPDDKNSMKPIRAAQKIFWSVKSDAANDPINQSKEASRKKFQEMTESYFENLVEMLEMDFTEVLKLSVENVKAKLPNQDLTNFQFYKDVHTTMCTGVVYQPIPIEDERGNLLNHSDFQKEHISRGALVRLVVKVRPINTRTLTGVVLDLIKVIRVRPGYLAHNNFMEVGDDALDDDEYERMQRDIIESCTRKPEFRLEPAMIQ